MACRMVTRATSNSRSNSTRVEIFCPGSHCFVSIRPRPRNPLPANRNTAHRLGIFFTASGALIFAASVMMPGQPISGNERLWWIRRALWIRDDAFVVLGRLLATRRHKSTERSNAAQRTREHLTEAEVNKLIDAASSNRHGAPRIARACVHAVCTLDSALTGTVEKQR